MKIYLLFRILFVFIVIQLCFFYYNINIFEIIFDKIYDKKEKLYNNNDNDDENKNINLEENIKDLTHALEELKDL